MNYLKKSFNYILISIFWLFFIVFRVMNLNNLEPIVDNYDSYSYFKFNFFGGLRMPLITFIYSNIHDYSRIIIFQNIVSMLCFLLLSILILDYTRNKLINLFASTSILLLSNTSQIVVLNSMISAESFQVSTTILLISALIVLFKYRFSKVSIIFFISALIIFSGIKTMNTIISIFLICFLILFRDQVNLEKRIRKQVFISFVGLITINLFYFFNTSVTPELNTSALINSRLWYVQEWRHQVIESKFPVEARSTYVRFQSRNLGLPPDEAVGKLEKYEVWYNSVGKNFITSFMLKNIDYTVTAPIALPVFTKNVSLDLTIWRGGALGNSNYNNFEAGELLNRSNLFKNFLWPIERFKSYLLLSLILLIIGANLVQYLFYFNSENFLSLFVILISFSFFSAYFSWWFGSSQADLGRHQLTFAVSIRVIFILSLCTILSRFNILKSLSNF